MATRAFRNIGIIGGGAWGTALAQTLCLAGRQVLLWAREADVVSEINDTHANTPFLPGVTLDKGLRATSALGDLAACDVILMVAPAQHLRAVGAELRKAVPAGMPVLICAKGIEQATGKLLVEVLSEVMPEAIPAILSGPSFAADVARGLPAPSHSRWRTRRTAKRSPTPSAIVICASIGRRTSRACSWAAP